MKDKKPTIYLHQALIRGFLLVAVIMVVLFVAETTITERSQSQNLRERLDTITVTFSKSYEETQELTQLYNDAMKAKAESLAFLLDNNDKYNEDNVSELCDLYDVEEIYVEDRSFDHYDSEGYRFYRALRENGQYVTIRQSVEELDEILNSVYTQNKVLENMITLDDMFFIVTTSTGDILYFPDETYIGKNISSLGIEMSDLNLNEAVWLRIAGRSYFLSSAENKELDLTFSCGIDVSDMTRNSYIAVGLLNIIVLIVFTVMVAYGYFCRQEEKSGENQQLYVREIVNRKMQIFMAAGLLLIAVVTFYVQTLFALSLHSLDVENTKRDIESNLAEVTNSVEHLTDIYNQRYLNEARIVSHIVSTNPDLRNKEDLAKLSKIFGLQYIMMFDRNGAETVSDSNIFGFVISDDPEDQSYPFNVLKHGIPFYVQEAREDDLTGEYHQFIGVTTFDRDGKYDGFLQIAVSPGILEQVLEELNFEHILSNAVSVSSDVVFAINKSDETIAYTSDKQNIIGEKASDVGMSPETIRTRYLGHVQFGTKRYYVDSFDTEDHIIYIASNPNLLFSGRMTMTLFTVLVSILGMLVYSLYFNNHDVVVHRRTGDDQYVEVTGADGVSKRTLSIVSRVLGSRTEWHAKTAEEKTGRILRLVFGFIAINVIIGYAMRGIVYTEDSIFGFITSNRWSKGFNVFAFTEVLLFLSIYGIAMGIFRRIMDQIIMVVSPKAETLCRLIKSFVRYIGTIAVGYYCLTVFGFDSASLLASAGLLTLVIGLGAKDLITDILAGMFIIFENEFQVGDIIEVGGFKGRVVEIGIRSTRLVNTKQDVKSVNNRDLTNIINKTRRNSYCDVIISVGFSEDINAIEAMLNEELPKVKDKCPYIISGPTYGGVDEMSGRDMKLSIRTECLENHKFEVRAVVNREIKNLFDKYEFKLG